MYFYELQMVPNIKRRSKEKFIGNKWHLHILLLYLAQSSTCILTSSISMQDYHFRLSLPSFLKRRRVVLVHVQMRRMFPGKFFWWKPVSGLISLYGTPLPQISFSLHSKCFVSCKFAIISYTSQSGQQYFAMYHQFLRFVSLSKLPFQSCPIDRGLPQWKLLMLLLNNARHGIGLIKMVHNPHDSIAQPCTVGHTRKSKLINFVSFLVYDTYPAKQTTVWTENEDTC